MDYFDLLKRAWSITWRYKALWVLGLFAGAMSGSGGFSGGSSGSGYSESGQELSSQWNQFVSWATDNIVLIAVVVGGLTIISIGLWILTVAAQGGIAHGTNEAAEGRTPALKESWSVGFSKWGRTFMVQFVLALPVFVVVMVMAAMVAVLGLSVAADSDMAGGIGVGMCFVFPLSIVVIIAASVIIGILLPVAIRYGVLLDVTYGQAIKRAWGDLWGKKGLLVFWLVMLLPGIAYGFVVFAIALVALIPAGVAFFAGQYVVAGAFGLLMVLLMMLPNAIYATFVNAAWTLMFRQLTGLEQPPARAAVTPGAPSGWADVPAPPAAPAPGPTAPPAPPASTPVVPPPPVPPGSDV